MLKNIIVIATLGYLMVSAFFVRIENFKQGELRSIDEIVYYRMGAQVSRDIHQYNTIAYGKELAATGRELPAYFFEPLFKHPPFFTFFIAIFLKVFGNTLLSAEYVPLIFGILTIPLIYLLGNKLYGWQVGLLSAIFFTLDPMSIICSQKVWMETTVAFLTVLSVYFFVKALKDRNDIFFVVSGIVSGLAAANKYNGALATIIFILYAFLYEKSLFKNKKFLISIIMPVVVLLPWFAWNFSVYGKQYLLMQEQMHSSKSHAHQMLRNAVAFLLLALAGYLLTKKIKNDFTKPSLIIQILGGAVCIFLFWPKMLLSLQLVHLPLTSWAGATFYGSPPTFYVDRLLEFSSIYLIAFLAYFVPLKELQAIDKLLRVSPLIILLFFTVWAGYQSRYIVAAIPFLIIMACQWLWQVYVSAENSPSMSSRLLLRVCVLLVLVFSVVKMQFINTYVSFPNDMCYF